jgi:hypothetical protein
MQGVATWASDTFALTQVVNTNASDTRTPLALMAESR